MAVRHPDGRLRLRAARAADVEALVGLEQAAFTTDHLSRRSFLRFATSPLANLIVCERDGRVLGYSLVLFRSSSRVARLYSIAVDPAAAGRGIGTLLLASAERTALRRGCDRLRLEVHEQNAAAISRYRKSGYQQFGMHFRYYDDHGNALRFEKRLRRPSTDSKDSASPRAAIAR
jgi:[ribosomal protein S18]-alanine N-acetyltransferase